MESGTILWNGIKSLFMYLYTCTIGKHISIVIVKICIVHIFDIIAIDCYFPFLLIERMIIILIILI